MTEQTEVAGTALVIGDVQRGIMKSFGDDPELLASLAAAASAARTAGVTVIYVKVGFRPGHPEISSNNPMWAGVATAGAMVETDEASQIHDAVAPQLGDIVVTKRRVGAFSGSDLDVVLRSRKIHELVLTGVATSGVILSTVRAAADLDYRLVVLSDAVMDRDAAVHQVLVEKIFPRQAQVMRTAEWVSSLGVAQAG